MRSLQSASVLLLAGVFTAALYGDCANTMARTWTSANARRSFMVEETSRRRAISACRGVADRFRPSSTIMVDMGI